MFMFLLKLNFFSYLLKLITAVFQLTLTTDLHPCLMICIPYLMTSHPIIPFFSNLIRLGDFNINVYSTSSSRTKLDVIISDTFNLKQIVNAPTLLTLIHLPLLILFFFHLTLTLLLVVFFLLSFIQTISLFFSPFPLILLTVPTPSLLVRSGYTISLTLSMLMPLLSSIDWKELLPLSDPNFSWAIFKELFLHIITTTVPSKLVYPLPTLIILGSNDHSLTMSKKESESSLLLKIWFSFSLGQIQFLL